MADPTFSGRLSPIHEPLEGTWVENSYIVKLKGPHSKDDHFDWLRPLLNEHESEITHGDWHSDAFHGYAGNFSPRLVAHLRTRHDIEYMVKNMDVQDDDGDDESSSSDSSDSSDDEPVEKVSDYLEQTDAPWGLARLSCDALPNQDKERLDFTYKFHRTAGGGVDIYVLDGGVYIEHDDFDRGRAKRGPTFRENHKGKTDKNHGTHCAGIAAGRRWGVAKEANIISVKIANEKGSRTTDSIISGMNYVISEQKKDKYRRCVISYSSSRLTDSKDVIAEVFKNAVNANITCVVAAGNDGFDCKVKSPAHLDCVITVGNSTIKDKRHSDSNYGKCVDIFAPGTHITSASLASKSATAVSSGTSMACPHVAGLIACIIATEGWHLSPEELKDKVKGYSRKNKLSEVVDSPNELAAQHIKPGW